MESPWPTRVGASICETCGIEPAVGVFGLSEMPVSAGIGERCLAEKAEPFKRLRKHAALVAAGDARNPAAFEDWLDKVKTYVDGEYVTIREALARYPLTPEEVARREVRK